MMREVIVKPSTLSGELVIQPSKSVSHRALICAAFSKGTSLIKNIYLSDDIKATISALTNMGIAKFELLGGNVVSVDGGIFGEPKGVLDCIESGSTLRFLIPIALTTGKEYKFTGQGRLLKRPLAAYEEICKNIGARWVLKDNILTVQGKLRSGEYNVSGDVSSQFITGLLFALSLIEGESNINITTAFESKGYVDLTIDVMKSFGVNIDLYSDKKITINGNQSYKSQDFYVEGDFSHAAFFMVAGALGKGVRCTGLNPSSLQSDKVILDVLKSSGAIIDFVDGGYNISKGELKPFICDISQCPDLAPILSIFASGCYGESRLENGIRLRYKESDRLSAMATELKEMGVELTEGEDYLVIKGNGKVVGGDCSSHKDHRVAMSLAIASLISENDIKIDDGSVVSKSAPNFWSEFSKLGGIYNVCNMGK